MCGGGGTQKEPLICLRSVWPFQLEETDCGSKHFDPKRKVEIYLYAKQKFGFIFEVTKDEKSQSFEMTDSESQAVKKHRSVSFLELYQASIITAPLHKNSVLE